jgi:hypothetical protein
MHCRVYGITTGDVWVVAVFIVLFATQRNLTLYFAITHTHTHTHTHTNIHIRGLPFRCLVAASIRARSPFSGVPSCLRPQLTATHNNGYRPLSLRSDHTHSFTKQVHRLPARWRPTHLPARWRPTRLHPLLFFIELSQRDSTYLLEWTVPT